MYIIDYNKLLEDWFETPKPIWTSKRQFTPSKFAVDIQDDTTSMALSVLGHDPKDIEINCFQDKIEIKAKKTEESNHPFNQLTSNIDEVINLGKDLDGTKAKAEIKNGILLITIEKREESKPKKLTPKVG